MIAGGRGDRRAAARRRPADRRLPRSRLPELAEEARSRSSDDPPPCSPLLALCFAAAAAADDQPAPSRRPHPSRPRPSRRSQAGRQGRAGAPRKSAPSLGRAHAPSSRKCLAPAQARLGQARAATAGAKWIGIAKRYPTMKPGAAGARAAAHGSLGQAHLRAAPPGARELQTHRQGTAERRGDLRQQWAEYQALPPQEREGWCAPAVDADKHRH